MKKIKKLDMALGESLDQFVVNMQSEVEAIGTRHKNGQNLSEYDVDNISKYTFYLFSDFRDHIIKFLKDNKK